MNTKILSAFLATTAMAVGVSAAMGCVADRPSRNGVFNENQYLRKSFLVRQADPTAQDPGWFLKATITQVSTPNFLGSNLFSVFPGTENGGAYVRFNITQDKLEMVNLREFSNPIGDQANQNTRVPEVVNAWPATNVDLKYRVNLDGEKTNFYEENQELPWDTRQWVKLNFAKNDMSDVAPFPAMNELLSFCVDMGNATTTLVPDSMKIDEPNDYLEWTTEITFPVKLTDPTCMDQYGTRGRDALNIGKYNETIRVKYSMVRPDKMTAPPPAQGAQAAADQYVPLQVDEKDAIRHKYGFFDWIAWNRDLNSGLVAARQLVIRFNPKKPITWYFAAGFPEGYKAIFVNKDNPNDPNTIQGQTNQLMKDAGVAATVNFLNADDKDTFNDHLLDPTNPKNTTGATPREYGDIRYSFLRWMSDPDVQDSFAGVTQFVLDPRTGEALTSSITFNDFAIKDYYVQRIDAYLQTLGASDDINSTVEWKQGSCTLGDTKPIVDATIAKTHNGTSTLYQKMQQYLQKPLGTFPNLGPIDFISDVSKKADQDFLNAYYAMMPYWMYADPSMNPFVIPEGGQGVYGPGNIWKMTQTESEFSKVMSDIDHGLEPYEDVTGPNGITNATKFLNHFRDLTVNHKTLDRAQHMIHPYVFADTASAFSFEQIMAKDAQHCIDTGDGSGPHWESKAEWTQNLIDTYWSQVAWHEFGHSLGLAHNFMGSIDKPNFPTYKDPKGTHYAMYSSSVMEYNSAPDRVFWKAGWGPYDQGAISWIYANDARGSGAAGDSISGQSSSTNAQLAPPWKDPHGFANGKETQYLFCSHQHLSYTPFCRMGDSGTTPSEIVANQIDAYEWQYTWRNFRKYRKLWDNSQYALSPLNMIQDMRRFVSAWVFDWGSGDLTDALRRLGFQPPAGVPALQYFTQLTNKFNEEASAANQMVAAFHEAIIQQASGERPYRTIYDKYYGDVTQQGIILDKLFAMQGWVALWPTDNYDPNQAGGYIASYSGIGDASYATVAEAAVDSMIGGQYDVYPYFVPLAVAQFAQDTHSPEFDGRIDVRDWIGGHVFYRLQDFLDYFRDLAVQNAACTDVKSCDYDPRPLSDNHNEFFGPDKRQWIWAYIPDRNTWVTVQKERNTAAYVIVRNYTDDVIAQLDDGAFPGGAYGALLPMKFFLDSFNFYN